MGSYTYDPDYDDDYDDNLRGHAHGHGGHHAHDCRHTHQHHDDHHQSKLAKIVAPFRKIYHTYYVPYLVWLGNKLGGRVNAGRIGRRSRMIRFLGNALTLTSIIVLIATIGFSTVWTLGAAAPLWALILGSCGIGINTVGFMMGSAANHLKIEQYYDEELRAHHENNQLRGTNNELEHGFHASNTKRHMLMARYAHDANGLLGSIASGVSSILEFLSIAVGLGGIFFMFSRISALISVIGAPMTNQYRLSVYKRSISKKINTYYQLKNKNDSEKHTCIYNLINQKFSTLNIDEKHYYRRWVKYRCYRAIDAVYSSQAEVNQNRQTIDKVLETELGKLLEHNSDPQLRFSRAKLQDLSSEKQSVLDNMPVLEAQIRYALLKESNRQNYEAVDSVINSLFQTLNPNMFLFVLNLKCQLIIQSISFDREKISNAITGKTTLFIYDSRNQKYNLNEEEIAKAYPLEGPHGIQMIPEFHTRQLVNDIIKSIR